MKRSADWLAAQSLDADARREMQMALEQLDLMCQENQRYAEFFQYAPDAYVITDAGGKMLEANQAASEFFAAARGDLIGQPLSAYIAAREMKVTMRAIALKKSGLRGLCWLLRPMSP